MLVFFRFLFVRKKKKKNWEDSDEDDDGEDDDDDSANDSDEATYVRTVLILIKGTKLTTYVHTKKNKRTGDIGIRSYLGTYLRTIKRI